MPKSVDDIAIREALEYDVTFVGGVPAGLSAAIRRKPGWAWKK